MKKGAGTKCAEKRWCYRRGGAAAVTDWSQQQGEHWVLGLKRPLVLFSAHRNCSKMLSRRVTEGLYGHHILEK